MGVTNLNAAMFVIRISLVAGMANVSQTVGYAMANSTVPIKATKMILCVRPAFALHLDSGILR